MEDWLFYLLSLVVALSVASYLSRRRKGPPLPPGPRYIPVLSPLLFLTRSSFDLESVLRGLSRKYGPILSLRVTSRPSIFVSDGSLAHRALIQHGAAFADRPASNAAGLGQTNISSSKYGPVWRSLRRNLTAEILHPSRVRLYAPARNWVLSILIGRLQEQMEREGRVVVIESFQFAMFCLLVLMCFGERLDEASIREIEGVQKGLMLLFVESQVSYTYIFFLFLLQFCNWVELSKLVLASKTIYFGCKATIEANTYFQFCV